MSHEKKRLDKSSFLSRRQWKMLGEAQYEKNVEFGDMTKIVEFGNPWEDALRCKVGQSCSLKFFLLLASVQWERDKPQVSKSSVIGDTFGRIKCAEKEQYCPTSPIGTTERCEEVKHVPSWLI